MAEALSLAMAWLSLRLAITERSQCYLYSQYAIATLSVCSAQAMASRWPALPALPAKFFDSDFGLIPIGFGVICASAVALQVLTQ
jgi:hypothetical protein